MEEKEYYPYLCIGVFFALLNEIKIPTMHKREQIKGKKNKVNQTDLMVQLRYALTGDKTFLETKVNGKNVTDIKQCKIDSCENFSFQKGGTLYRSFNDHIENRYLEVLERFTSFYKETIIQDKSRIDEFFKRIVWIVKEDTTIDAKEEFRTTYQGEKMVPKEEFDKIDYLEIQPFSISILEYILRETDNTLGKNTYSKWFERQGERHSKYEFGEPTIADDIQHIDAVFCKIPEEPEGNVNESSKPSVVIKEFIRKESTAKNQENDLEQRVLNRIIQATDPLDIDAEIHDLTFSLGEYFINLVLNAQKEEIQNIKVFERKIYEITNDIYKKIVKMKGCISADDNLRELKCAALDYLCIFLLFKQAEALVDYCDLLLEKANKDMAQELAKYKSCYKNRYDTYYIRVEKQKDKMDEIRNASISLPHLNNTLV